MNVKSLNQILAYAEPHANLDEAYGPYTTLEEAYLKTKLSRAIGLTVGIYTFRQDDYGEYILDYETVPRTETQFEIYKNIGTSSTDKLRYSISGIIEYLWKEGTEDMNLVPKIEEYELKLVLFRYLIINTNGEDVVRIYYQVSGKGLLPKVTISGTSVQQEGINFGVLKYVDVKPENPGIYKYQIMISDALGTTFNSNGISTIINVPWGDIIRQNLYYDEIKNLLPIQSLYEGKHIRFALRYNKIVIKNIKIFLNNHELLQQAGINSYTDDETTFTGYITLPTGNDIYVNGDNVIKAKYTYTDPDTLLEENRYLTIHSFKLLPLNTFALEDNSSSIPGFGYIGSNMIFDVKVLYGGGSYQSSTIDVDISLVDTENNNEYNLDSIKANINSNTYVPYKIKNELEQQLDGNDLKEFILKIQISGESAEPITKTILIKKSLTPKNTYGSSLCFNKKHNIFRNNNDITINNLTIDDNHLEINWSGEYTNVMTMSSVSSFSFDIYLKASLTGENDTLVEIKNSNDESLIKIGRQYITSDLFSTLDSSYQTNNLSLPANEFVHIGFGYKRIFNSGTKNIYYSCIFINGEIAFCSESKDVIGVLPSSTIKIFFENDFVADEMAISLNDNVIDYLYLSGDIDNSGLGYNLLEGSLVDVFYYNWLTLLDQFPLLTELTKLQLTPFVNVKTDGEETKWWKDLKALIPNLGKPIEELEQFVRFGKIKREGKDGIVSTNCLFDFTFNDKEISKYDKKYGVICKYKIENNNGICIVLVLGTSTLTYPVPNFLFTFLSELVNQNYDQNYDPASDPSGENITNSYKYLFSLDNSIKLQYKKPVLLNTIDNLFINIEDGTESVGDIEFETNLVAKADSMDSSHLNNTPTCIYYNSLLDALVYDKNDFDNFSKFNQDYQDAIVGFPILLEIDERDTFGAGNSRLNEQCDFGSKFNSYGTFMLNTGKSAKSMGLTSKSNPVYSLEGQSNLNTNGSAGIFTLPNPNLESATEKEQNIYNAFNKITIDYSNNLQLEYSGNFSNNDKILISNYLVSSKSFESRSTYSDKKDFIITSSDDSETIAHKWENVEKFLRMWIFVCKSSDEEFRNNFTKCFDKNYAIIYYINLILFGQADNLGKNMMLDSNDGTIWYVRPYDLDSELGLTNAGFDDFPVYACISEEHFLQRYRYNNTNHVYPIDLPSDTLGKYSSYKSNLWEKFWRVFNEDIELFYKKLRDKEYVTPEKFCKIGETVVRNLISKELYNIDFYDKHLGTSLSFLNKGGRFLNYKNWIEKRFMYVDSYFKYFKVRDLLMNGLDGYYMSVGKTLVPIFYEIGYQASMDTVYGYKEYTYNKSGDPMESRLKYDLWIVPEAVLTISPMWSYLLERISWFKNLKEYSGLYDDSIKGALNNNELNNISKLELISSNSINDSIKIPNSVRTIILQDISADVQNNIFNFENSLNSGIEEIYILHCTIPDLSLSGLPLLKTLEISDSSIGSLSLNTLSLRKLNIDYKTNINTLSLINKITYDNILDLSGLQCNNITFSNSPIEELYINQLYNLNGTIYSIYDFGPDKKIQISNEINNNYSQLKSSNILTNGEYIYLNSTNFSRISPTILELNLEEVQSLKLLSCVGSSILTITGLSTTVKTLNLLFCKKLTTINSDNEEFNFSGFTGLKCKPFTSIGRTFVARTASMSGYQYYRAIDNTSVGTGFNLMGCDSVKSVKNLCNLDSSFTGSYFLTGCRKLQNFLYNGSYTNSKIEFKNLKHSFAMTESITAIPDNFVFNLSASSNISCAFCDCRIDAGTILSRLSELSLSGNDLTKLQIQNAQYAFAGTPLTNGIGTEEANFELYWKDCLGIFRTSLYAINSSGGFDYEYLCYVDGAFGSKIPSTEVNGECRHIYIELPYATTVHRMFLERNVKIENDNVFSGNTSLSTAYGFLANTKLEILIDFTTCTSLKNAGYCYSSTNINNYDDNFTNKTITLGGEQINVKKFVNCKLPPGILNIEGLFRNVDLTNVDVAGIFTNISNIIHANACFMNTNCICSGNPFNNSCNPDISAMFATTSDKYDTSTPGFITDLSWIKSSMCTSHIGLTGADSVTTTSLAGVFEGRQIYNFRFDLPTPANVLYSYNMDTAKGLIANQSNSWCRMFKDAKINSYVYSDDENLNILQISVRDASLMFEDTDFSLTSGDSIKIRVTSNVVNLTRTFLNTLNMYLEIDFEDNNNIAYIDSCFYGSNGGQIKIVKKELTILDNTVTNIPVYFPKLLTASLAFSDSSSITGSTFPSPDASQELENLDNVNIFMGCNYLSDISKIYQYGTTNIEFNFSSCSNLENIDYAFANSAIRKLPKMPASLNKLTSSVGTFRGLTLDYSSNENLLLTAPVLVNANELFALSTINGDGTITCLIKSNKLESINAINTNNKFITLIRTICSPLTALLIHGAVGGTLSTENIGGEEARTLYYTEVLVNDNIQTGWSEILTHRNKSVSGKYDLPDLTPKKIQIVNLNLTLSLNTGNVFNPSGLNNENFNTLDLYEPEFGNI